MQDNRKYPQNRDTGPSTTNNHWLCTLGDIMTESQNQSDSLVEENKTKAFFRGIMILTIAFVCGIMVTFGISKARKVEFVGFMHSQQTSVHVLESGIVSQIPVQTNAMVEKDDVIAVLVNPQLQDDIDAVTQEIKALKAERDQVIANQKRRLSGELHHLDRQVNEVELKQASLLKDKFTQELQVEAWKGFAQEIDQWLPETSPDKVFREDIATRIVPTEEARIRAITKQQVALNNVEASAAQMKICERDLETIAKRREELLSEDNDAQLAGIEVRLEQANDLLKRLEEKKSLLTLKASDYGTVGVLRVQVGEPVASMQKVVDIMKVDQPFLTVRIPTTQAVELKTDNIVYLKFPGNQKRIGRVDSVPPQADPVADGEDMTYLTVRINPAGKLWPEDLPMGSAVTVSLKK